MEKPTKRTVAIPAGHGFKTRALDFYHPTEVDAYIAHLEQRAEAAEGWVKTAERTMDYQAGVITELGVRAEAAEAYSKSLNDIIDLREKDLRASEAKLQAERETSDIIMESLRQKEVKLAELANKKPDIMVSAEGAEAIRAIMNREMSAAGRYVTLKRPSGIGEEGMIGIYICPAPAADLSELVLDESGLADRHITWLNTLQRPMFSDEDWEELTLYTWLAFRDSFRIYRTATLRNIKETK